MLEDEDIIDGEDIIEDDEDDGFTPFLDALNEEEEEEETDDTELEEDDDDVSSEVLKERIKQRNRTIAKGHSANKRMQKEIDELKAGAQITPELLAQLVGSKESDSDETGGLDVESLKEQVEEDPASVIDIILNLVTNSENKVASVLERRDTALLKKAKVVVDPVVQKTMEALATQDEFAGFTEGQLESVARKMLKVTGNRRPPAGTSGAGRRKSGGKAKAPTNSELEKKYSSQLDEMGLGAGG